MNEILDLARQLADKIDNLPYADKVEALNQSRKILGEASPFKSEPIDCPIWVEGDLIIANDYNPNSVASPEKKLLEHSIRKNGFAMPVIAAPMPSSVAHLSQRPQRVVDGFHRHQVGKNVKDIKSRLGGYLPIVNIAGDATDLSHLMSATVEFNRARGEHSIELMAGVVKEMILLGKSDVEIAKDLGMEAEEVLRLKQVTGLASLFAGQTYSKAWEAIWLRI